MRTRRGIDFVTAAVEEEVRCCRHDAVVLHSRCMAVIEAVPPAITTCYRGSTIGPSTPVGVRWGRLPSASSPSAVFDASGSAAHLAYGAPYTD